MNHTLTMPEMTTGSHSVISSRTPNVTAHVPPTGVIRNIDGLLQTLEQIIFVYNIEGYFIAGNDYLARKVRRRSADGRKVSVSESTAERHVSRLQELKAIHCDYTPGIGRSITPLLSVEELRTLLKSALRELLTSRSPYRSLSSESDVSSKAKLTTKTDTVAEPSVGCSLASQKEKDNETLRSTETKADTNASEAHPTDRDRYPVPSRSQAVSRRKVRDEGRRDAVLGTPELLPLDLPAAAAQLVDEGKITEGFAASVLASVPSETLSRAISAAKEQEAKGNLRTWAGFLRMAVTAKWRPNGPALPPDPGRPQRIWKAPALTVAPPKPDKSTMYREFTREELDCDETVAVKMPPKIAQASVGTPEGWIDKLPSALRAEARQREARRRTEGVTGQNR